MRHYIIGSVVLATALLVGCGSDGGECCGAGKGSLAGLGAETIPPKGPAAIFDGNWTTEKNSKSSGSFNSTQIENTDTSGNDQEAINFIFNCNSSYNQDDINISIRDCAWSFSDTADCLDKNASVGKVVNVKYSCDGGLIKDGNLTAILKVTDELNQTAESNATLKIQRTGDADIAKVSI